MGPNMVEYKIKSHLNVNHASAQISYHNFLKWFKPHLSAISTNKVVATQLTVLKVYIDIDKVKIVSTIQFSEC